MSTSAAEDLQNALSCIKTFVTEIGPQFVDLIPQTAQALIPLFDLGMNDEVRELAYEVWGELLNSAKVAGRQPLLTEMLNELLKRTIPRMQMKDADDGTVLVAIVTSRVNGVTSCLKKAGPNVLGI